MGLLTALKEAVKRQGPDYKEHGVLVVLTLRPEGVLVTSKWRDRTRRIFESCKIVSWTELEQARNPARFLDDHIDREIADFLSTQKELDGADGGPSSDETAPYRRSIPVPIWERNDSFCGLGDT